MAQSSLGDNVYKRFKKYILTVQQLRANGYPRAPKDGSKNSVIIGFGTESTSGSDDDVKEVECYRCKKSFKIVKGEPYPELGKCVYHLGVVAISAGRKYHCCFGKPGSVGCESSRYHVHRWNLKNDLAGYKETKKSESSDKNEKVYALDCEMIYTTGGLELARITIIDAQKKTVYDEIVRPDNKVTDYNTKFSGITTEIMADVETRLSDVQDFILKTMSSDTILLGHSLESDLVVMKIIHGTVVDTSVAFPHIRGLPFKSSLRYLTEKFLDRRIHVRVKEGHDSKQDAVACLELMLNKSR